MTSESTHFRFVDAVRRRWWLALLCAAIAGGGAFLLVASRPATYEATALLRFTGRSIDDQILGSAPRDPDLEQTLIEAVPDIDQDRTAVRALERLRFNPPLSPAQIQAATSVGFDTRQGMMAVRARRPEPAEAAKVANAYARAYVDLRRRGDRLRIQRALEAVQLELARTRAATRRAAGRAGLDRRATETALAGSAPEISALQQRAQQLAILRRLTPSSVSIARAAAPPSAATGLSPVTAGIAGAILGSLLGLGLIALRDGTDRRLRNPSDFERALGAPVLARVPRTRPLRGSGRALEPLPDRDARPLALLAAQLRFSANGAGRRLLAVSALGSDPSEARAGWQLACAMASTGARTLFIDTSVPGRGSANGEAEHGALEQVLAGSLEAADAVRPASDGLDLLAPVRWNGVTPLSHAAEISRLLAWAKEEYEAVVVRTRPLATDPDAVPFIRSVDGLLVACRRDATPAAARTARDAIGTFDAPLVGLIVVGASRRDDD